MFVSRELGEMGELVGDDGWVNDDIWRKPGPLLDGINSAQEIFVLQSSLVRLWRSVRVMLGLR